MQILKTGSTGAEVALLQLSLRRAQYGAPAPDGIPQEEIALFIGKNPS